MRGDGDVVGGWKNTLQSAIATVTPQAFWPNNIAAWPSPGPPRKPTSKPTVVPRW
jgi:hypothetical protein